MQRCTVERARPVGLGNILEGFRDRCIGIIIRIKVSSRPLSQKSVESSGNREAFARTWRLVEASECVAAAELPGKNDLMLTPK